jgi:hypothetical protein
MVRMPKRKVTFDAVRKIALGLPGAEESTAYGSPAFKVHGKMFAGIPVNKSVEPDSLAVYIDFDQRAELLAEAPEVYYLRDHYKDYPVVLLRLNRVDADALRDLLRGAWQFVSAATKGKRTIRKKDSRPTT